MWRIGWQELFLIVATPFLWLLPPPLPAQAQDALVVAACGTLPLPYAAGSTRQLTVDVNGLLCEHASTLLTTATVVTPAPIAPTASAALVMAGLGSTLTLTPPSGLLRLAARLSVANDIAGGGCLYLFATGTGAPPTAGALFSSLSDVALGSQVTAISMSGGQVIDLPDTYQTVVGDGVTPGEPHWFDIAYAASGGGVCTISGLSLTITELAP